jgi:sugar-specific transcriptional regulator TrmB
MDEEELLRSTGLTKYESAAYRSLIRNGLLTAKELSKIGNVPMGKIYEVLSLLEEKGFIEVQKGRPILYRPVKPSIAFKKYFDIKKRESEIEMERLKETIAVVNSYFPRIISPITKERVFVSTVMGRNEITTGYTDAFKEAEDSIYVLNSVKMKEIHRWAYHDTVAPLIDVIFQEAKRGVKLYCIDPGTGLKEIFEEKIETIEDNNIKELVKENIRIKIKDSNHDFCLVDDILSIIDVGDPIIETMIAIMKIYDVNFNERLKKHFMEIWNTQ